MDNLNTFGIIGILIGITNVALSFLVYSNDRKNKINRLWALFTLSVSTWGFSSYAITLANDPQTAIIIWRLAIAGVIFIPITFFAFTYQFIGKRNLFGKIFITVIGSILLILDATPYLLTSVQFVFNSYYWSLPSPIYDAFVLFFMLTITWSLYIAFHSYLKANEPDRKQQLFFFILASLIGFLGGSTSYLPTFGIHFYPYLNGTIIIFSVIITYSIIKHHLFNIKLITAQSVTFILWIFISVRLLFAQSPREFLIDGSLLIITILFGFILIRSVLNEIDQRKNIEKLANELKDLNIHLSEKVAEQTVEIRKAYELERKARRELEKLNETKDQFIMITQHHLRTPVTSIRWNIEEMLKGTYGKFQIRQIKALEDTNTAVGRLIRIVDDFLSITALKIGSQILTISYNSILPLLEDVFNELRYTIEEKQVHILYSKKPESWPKLPIDASKIRETILIVIENAIRYNIQNGNVNINTHLHNGMFEMIVENTGIGITREEHEKLFTSLFYRSDSAKSAHPIGMGVGLSVSRAIIRAHHGELTIESEGRNRGAKAILTLPLEH